MPFVPPFRNEFFEGDLIYGLAKGRESYIRDIDKFKIVKRKLDKSTSGQEFFKPPMINYYLIPSEEREMISFLDNFNNSMKNRKVAPSLQRNNQAYEYRRYLNVVAFEGYKEYKESFYSYLKKHDKYHTVLDENIDNKNVTIGRKCKGGLSWVSMSNYPLTPNMHIHFILDGINIEEVVSKTKDSITAKELRWIYRNRNSKKVASKIQFWLNQKPIYPPWVLNETLWDNYYQRSILNRDLSGELSRLFNMM
ncbi:hypothetical protein PSI23_14675 [Xenorhabdus sp. XENO-10]|uniref:Transposase n=1 Tax=Xenorhabdus yunnanensis TaxID=3025878 RepID=A0ABT5LHS4_9GAMM|nr:hypothetical protein [Xenorhabdus yunnanensis]MDC9590499.1 hypothetical protein [Xenorhabdus yunnanensis]